MVIGVRTLLPYNNSNGVNPVLSCGVSRTANISGVKYRCQSLGLSAATFNIFFIVLLKFSTTPLPMAWYGLVVGCWIESSLLTSDIIFNVNWLPRSLWILRGIPTRLKIPINASATVLVWISFNGTASGNCVQRSITVKINRCPSDGGDNGPNKSPQIVEYVSPQVASVQSVHDPHYPWTHFSDTHHTTSNIFVCHHGFLASRTF